MADPIVFERIIDADPDEAFRLFTDPERLRRWQAVTAAVDLTVGGEYRLTVTPGNVANGEFVEIDPGKRLVYSWGWGEHHSPPPGGSTIAVDFEPQGSKTLVRLTHSGLDAEQAASHSEGWEHYCDRLVDAAAAGDAGYDEWSDGPEPFDHLGAAEASWAVCKQVMYGFGADDRTKQTPCAEYTVHDLVEHTMESMRGLGGAAGATIPDKIDAATAEDYLGQAVEPTLAAWRARGVDGEVPFGEGTAPATMMASILSLEFLLHAWDFGQATGQAVPATDRLVNYVQGLAESVIRDEYRGEGKGFAAQTTPSSDDPLTVLAAFTGRNT